MTIKPLGDRVVLKMVEAETTELCEKYAAMIADVIKERGHCVD
jgi:co-chaperonin GroES (HSP10)